MITCPCGQPVRCKGLCGSCYWKQYRQQHPRKVWEHNQRIRKDTDAPDPLDALCMAFNIEPLQLAWYILERRDREPRHEMRATA